MSHYMYTRREIKSKAMVGLAFKNKSSKIIETLGLLEVLNFFFFFFWLFGPFSHQPIYDTVNKFFFYVGIRFLAGCLESDSNPGPLDQQAVMLTAGITQSPYWKIISDWTTMWKQENGLKFPNLFTMFPFLYWSYFHVIYFVQSSGPCILI